MIWFDRETLKSELKQRAYLQMESQAALELSPASEMHHRPRDLEHRESCVVIIIIWAAILGKYFVICVSPAEHWAGGSFMMSFNSLLIRFWAIVGA